MSDHRGRSRRDYYDDDYYEPKPRHRSLSRRVVDKLGDAMGSLGLESSSRTSSPPRHYDSYYYDDDRPSRRTYHSASPTRRHDHHRGRSESSTHHGHSGSSERSRSRWTRGIAAAVDAAAIEAFRLRNEPGPWKGAKGGRIATAAISAGVIGAATDHGKRNGEGNKKGALGSALGGLVVNRLVNGPRREVRYQHEREYKGYEDRGL